MTMAFSTSVNPNTNGEALMMTPTTMPTMATARRTNGEADLAAHSLPEVAARLLIKRNVIRDSPTGDPRPQLSQVEQMVLPPAGDTATGLGQSITAIRAQVTRVLHMYFHNKAGAYSPSSSTQPLLNSGSSGSQDAVNLASTLWQNSTAQSSNNVIAAISHQWAQTPMATGPLTTPTPTIAGNIAPTIVPEALGNITYPSYGIAISSYENCSALFANYTQPQSGLFCNWTWDMFLCWPPTPAGVLAHMSCPAGFHGVDARKFAQRRCDLSGHWGGRPNETLSANGWTDYNPCFKQEVQDLFKKVTNIELVFEIARRTRTLEIVGLILSLLALILSLIIFCNFRSLRNNRTKIHKNLFIAMVLQVVIRLSLYLDQAFRRDKTETLTNTSMAGIENTPYVCEASYVLLEYAKTAMFMWMFIEGWYLHNMVTVTVFQGRFPYELYYLVGWGMPVLMTTVWAICTAVHYADTMHDCWWNYNLTPYYWILEGPRIIIIMINFAFLLNIIRVLVMKLRESQASDIEQTRKAVRAAIVLLPLLGTINVLYLIPALETPWKFALWSYVTHFLTTFQGFFIALIYCFLNGEVRAVLLKSLAVYMSVRGHPEWVPKRASMYSAGYNTAPDTDNHNGDKRNDSPAVKRMNGRKGSCTTVIHQTSSKTPRIHITPRLSHSNASGQAHNHNHLPMVQQNDLAHLQRLANLPNNNNNAGSQNSLQSLSAGSAGDGQHSPNGQHQPCNHHTNHRHSPHQLHATPHPYVHRRRPRHSWMLTLCFRGQKVLRVPPASSEPPETNV